MRQAAEPGAPGAARFLRGSAPFIVTAVAVFLGWQIVREMAIQRLPPPLAVRVAPGGASTLSRAAESEFTAGRFDNAEYLARLSLAKAPFSVRTLRVIGLVEARKGQTARADNLLTLAGNWSLRDDPAHAWLFEHRLRRGQYGSAFAHADTLARRREDMWPKLFELFAVAGTEDPRALPVLVALVAKKPPWRQAFLNGLIDAPTPRNQLLLATIATSLQQTKGPLNNDELVQVYQSLLRSRQEELLVVVRARIGRPATSLLLVNGGFSPLSGPAPFEWTLTPSVGIVPDVTTDPTRPSESALRVEYNGFSRGEAAGQLLQLTPGRYRLTGRIRAEAGAVSQRLQWSVKCYPTNQILSQTPTDGTDVGPDWRPLGLVFEVPPQGCRMQRLTLDAVPTDTRSTIVGWYDKFAITRVG